MKTRACDKWCLWCGDSLEVFRTGEYDEFCKATCFVDYHEDIGADWLIGLTPVSLMRFQRAGTIVMAPAASDEDCRVMYNKAYDKKRKATMAGLSKAGKGA